MNKLLIVPLVLSVLAVVAVANTLTASTADVKINVLYMLGKGIAANPSDPMDFMIAKFGIGKAAYTDSDIYVNSTLGVLRLDDELYRLRDIVISEGKATGDIYRNSTKVGSFDLSSVMKGDTEVWAGTMAFESKNYNLYVIEGVRPVRASELRERVMEYCNHTEDENCRDRLSNYCENNQEDARCKALFRAYCLKSNNMDDTRCRQVFMGWCQTNSANPHCVQFALNRSRAYCEEHSDSNLCKKIALNITDFCQNNPDNWGCAVVKRVIEERPRLLQKMQTIRNRISELRANVTPDINITSSDVEGEE